MVTILPKLEVSLASIGLQLNRRKSTIWGPGANALQAAAPDTHIANYLNEIPWNSDQGMDLLGATIDRPGTITQAQAKWDKALQQLQNLLEQIESVPDPSSATASSDIVETPVS